MTNTHTVELIREMLENRPDSVAGFCIDTEAPHSAKGRKEISRVFIPNRINNRKIIPSNKRFRFADTAFTSGSRVYIKST